MNRITRSIYHPTTGPGERRISIEMAIVDGHEMILINSSFRWDETGAITAIKQVAVPVSMWPAFKTLVNQL